MKKISFGHIIVCWYYLHLSVIHQKITVKDASSIILSSSILGGSIPLSEGRDIGLKCNLFTIKNGEIEISNYFNSEALIIFRDLDYNVKGTRLIIKSILERQVYSWLLYYSKDHTIFQERIAEESRVWLNILNNANLFEQDTETENWWRKILYRYERISSEKKKAIGDVGELLSYNYELNRVKNIGFIEPKNHVKWVSRFSDGFGYDIRSIIGENRDESDIYIEVKSTSNHNLESFRFYISKNEWLTAVNQIESYYFYCWIGIDVKSDTAKMGPWIIPAISINNQMPVDKVDNFSWSECRVIINLDDYGKPKVIDRIKFA